MERSATEPSRVLVVGCGYTGLPLAGRLARLGHRVSGLRRTCEADDAMTAAAVAPIHADVTRLDDLGRLAGQFDWVINLVSSSRGDATDYRAVYLCGMRNLIEAFSKAPPTRFIHISSTSVYAQSDGTLVTEASEAAPLTETGQILVQTEQALLDAVATRGFPGTILRPSGIYGPGRGHLFRQLIAGEARVTDDGSRVLNMIHRDDLCGAIEAALEGGRPGEIYNVSDDEPVEEREFFQWCCRQLDLPMPRPAAPGTHRPRRRGASSKRVSNHKLRSLGWQLLYPTFREGYADEIARIRFGLA